MAMRWTANFSLCAAFVAAACASSCSDGSNGSDAGVDAGADGDAGNDADSDADADAGPFVCEVSPQRVYDDVAYLASDELAGRYRGTAGNEAALAWGEALFEELGLVPAGDDGTYRQAFDTRVIGLLEPPALTVGGTSLVAGEDFSVFERSSSSGDVTAEIVFAGYGLTVPAFDPADYPDCPLPPTGYNDYAGIDVLGKIVLLLPYGPGDEAAVQSSCPANATCNGAPCLDESVAYKVTKAHDTGAAAIILMPPLSYAPDIGSLDDMGSCWGSYPRLPALYASREVMAEAIPDLETWIAEIDETMAPASVATGVTAHASVSTGLTTVETYNLLGALPGTDPDLSGEVVVVGGHIDHLGTDESNGDLYAGADDNASGAAVTVELARLLSHCAAPARTTLFALWNAEEAGLVGSQYYVDHPTYPLEKTVAAYSVDMVGAGDGSGLVLYGALDYDGAENDNSWLGEVMAHSAAAIGLEWEVTPASGPGSSGSDDGWFSASGVPAVWAISGLEETHPSYHTPADTIDGISLDTLEMSASMMYAGVKPLVEGTEEQYLAGVDAGMDAGK